MRGDRRLLQKAATSVMTHPSLFFSSPSSPLLLRSSSSAPPAAMATTSGVIQQKRALRSEIRRALKAFSPAQRAQEDLAIQSIVLDSPWFKSSTGLCAYISCEALFEVDTSKIIREVLEHIDAEHDAQVKKKLYVPRVEDKNSHMCMLNISRIDDLVANSMNILEPSPIDTDGNAREDVMLASDPVDILLLPGLAFDRHGRRLGRGGGYYDMFLKKYQELATERRWKLPLLVALAYSVQIVEDDIIPMTPHDVPIDVLVSASGVLPINPAALERM